MTPLATVDGQGAQWLPALFTTVSASCVTGLTVVNTGLYWSQFGQAVIILLIQVGGLGGGPNRKAVFQNITLDEKDVGILSDLKNRGIQVFFQTIPEDKPQSLDDILKKF